MDIMTFIKSYWSQISLLLGSIGTFFIGKRMREISEVKGEAEIDAIEIKNLSDLLDVYKTMHLDLGLKVKSIKKEYDDLEKMYNLMKEKLFGYELKIKGLERENKDLRDMISACDYDCKTHLKKNKL
jgi:hypothetical protein